MLRVAQRAAHALQSRRVRRGSLDFDLPDSDVILGEEGEAVAILKAVRNEAHRLVEEFMLAANEAVARHLMFVPTPALYRVHDRPDETRLAALRVVLGPLGYDLPEDEEEVTPAMFQAILDQAEGKPEERFVDDLVLRSQKKALYSEDCRGHYALAATYYAHFTSPIRRYPDVICHRALVRELGVADDPLVSRDFRGDSAFYTWLYRIGINTAKNYLIAQGRRAPISTEYDSEEAEGFDDAVGLRDINTPEALLMSKQIGQTVNAAIDALPEELRTAITLREIDGLAYEEIAKIMECPIGTVRSRIFRAREAVAEKLRPQPGTGKDKRW